MKLLLASLFLCICSFNSFAQSDQQCSNFIFGDYISVSNGDTVYIFRRLSHWMECEVNTGDTYNFDVHWRGDCNFRLRNNTTGKIKGEKYKDIDTMNYIFQSYTDSSVTYTVNAGKKAFQQTLIKKKGLDVLMYAFNHDKEFKDEIKNDKLDMLTPSDSGKSEVPKLEKMMKDILYNKDAENKLAYILLQLRQNNFFPSYSIAGYGLKSVITDSMMAEYSLFLKNTYGQLSTYDVTSYAVKGNGNNFNSGKPGFNGSIMQDSTVTYKLRCRFVNVDSIVTISVTFDKDSSYKLLMINVVAKDYTPSKFISSVCAPFWKSMENNEYDSIYNSTIDTFKKMVSLDRMKYILGYVKATGSIPSYKLFNYDFGPKGKTGLLYINYVTGEGDKQAQLTLVYHSKNGNYKLAGINIK